jgi:hypothetical protein
MLLQDEQRKIECRMQRDRREQRQRPTRNPCPVAVMAIGAERGAGARDRDIRACDNAERAVKRHGQHAAQRRQRSPHVGVLHQVGEILVRRETEARGGTVDHGVHRIGKTAAPDRDRDRDDDENFHDLFRRGDTEHRAQGLRHPGVSGHGEDRRKRRARDSQ